MFITIGSVVRQNGFKGFPGGSVKKLSAEQEMQVWSLGQKDPLEEMETYSSVLAWEIPGTEEPGRPWGHKELDMT